MSVKVTVEIPGLDNFSNLLKQAPNKTKEEMSRAVDASAAMIERYAKIASPVVTGRMRASIYSRPLMGELGRVISPNTIYAYFVHEGINPKTNRPTRKGPQRFMLEGLNEARPEIDRFFETAADNVVQFITRGR